MMADTGREAWRSLRASPRRAVTLGAIVAIGVALPVVAVAVGRAGQRDVTSEFDRRQATEIALIDTDADPKGSRGFVSGVGDEMQRLGPVVAAGTLLTLEPVAVSVRHAEPSERQVTVLGVDESTFDVYQAVVRPRPRWRDGDCTRREAVVGADVAARLGIGLFDGWPSMVEAAGQPLAAVGVLTEAPLGEGMTNAIAVPECVARSLDAVVVSKRLVIRVETGAADAVARQAALVARPGDPQSLTPSYVPSPIGLRSVVEATTRRTFLAVAVGVGALAAMVLGVVNAAAVGQRRAEIGLRRVFGARRRDIFWQIVVESLLLGVFGGALGAWLGIAAVIAASIVGDWVPVLDWYLWCLGPLGGAGVGIIAGLMPAKRATSIEPRAALTHE